MLHRPDNKLIRQLLAIRLRDIGHLVDATHVLLIEPLRYLTSRELGHPQLLHDSLQFVERHAKQNSLILLHLFFLAAKIVQTERKTK